MGKVKLSQLPRTNSSSNLKSQIVISFSSMMHNEVKTTQNPQKGKLPHLIVEGKISYVY